MVCAAVGVMLVMITAGSATAQIGKSVSVAAGTPEDKALTDIYAATDGPDKIALLDKFMADFGKGDMELLGDQLYVQTYLAQKNYAKVYEYGDKVLALDPDNFSTAVIMVQAAEEQGDSAKLFDAGQKVAEIVTRYKSTPPPEGTAADAWNAQKAGVLKTGGGRFGLRGICAAQRRVQDRGRKRARGTSGTLRDHISGFHIHGERARANRDRLPAGAELAEDGGGGAKFAGLESG